MTVDCHVHIWQRPEDAGLRPDDAGGRRRRLAADVSDHMEAARAVDLSLVWGFASRRLGAEVPIDFIGQHVGLHGSRMIGIAGIDPTDPAWRNKLLEAVDEWGFRGVTICPACQDVHPLDNRALALYELCTERGLPLMIDQPAEWVPRANLSYARADLLDAVAREFPALRILVSGFAWPYVNECLVLLEKFPAVFTDTAHLANRPQVLSQALSRAWEAGVTDRVLFGSGFPLAWPRKVLSLLFGQCSAQHSAETERLPREVIESLTSRDALDALGIPRPAALPAKEGEPAEEKLETD